MIDSLKNKVTPEGCNPHMWVCKYNDGKYVEEFESKDKENSFLDIEKDKVEELHLIGRKLSTMFDTSNGSFTIVDENLSSAKMTIDFSIDINGTEYKLSNNIGDFHDIIQYKGFYTDGMSNFTGNLECHTCSYHIGWKKRFIFEKDNIDIFFKVVFSIIEGQAPKFELRISSKNDLDGKLILIEHLEGFEKPVAKLAKEFSIKKNKAFEGEISFSVNSSK